MICIGWDQSDLVRIGPEPSSGGMAVGLFEGFAWTAGSLPEMQEVRLKADRGREVVRIGETVRRTTFPWSPAVHRLLEGLEARGFPYSPRFLGIDEHGREVLSWIDGICGGDGYVEGVERGATIWAMVADPAGLARYAQLVREYHDAVAGLTAADDACWATRKGGPEPGELICHLDLSPWNVVWQEDGQPVGIIDWDYAEPADPIRDVAYALEWSVPFCSDEECLRWRRFDSPPDRPARIAQFASAYGLTNTAGLVNSVLDGQQAFYDREVALAGRGIQPTADDVANGYLEVVQARIQWTLDHRDLLE